MSNAHQDPRAVAAHDADAHAFDGEPARALPADEPPTPLWVPALGLALFVVAGVAFLAGNAPDAPAQPAPARGAAEAERHPASKPAEQKPAAAAPQPIQRPAPGAAAPGAAPSGVPSANIRKLTAEEVDAMRKRIMEARQKGGAEPQPVQPTLVAPK
jgi:hypothetical protein